MHKGPVAVCSKDPSFEKFWTFVKSGAPAGDCWAEELATPGVQGKCAVRVMYMHVTGDQVLYIHPGDQLLYIHVTGDQLTMYNVHACKR